jgi:hypothetical protein
LADETALDDFSFPSSTTSDLDGDKANRRSQRVVMSTLEAMMALATRAQSSFARSVRVFVAALTEEGHVSAGHAAGRSQ